VIDSLLARSFALIGSLLVVSILASFQLYRLNDREPRAREIAQQTVSVVNLTRAALINSDPERRRELLIELNEREGLRLYPADPSDRLEPLPDDPLLARVVARVRAALGARTRFAYARDGIEGFWVSFFIDTDEFWAMLPRERLEPEFGATYIGWAALVTALALVGAWLVASGLSRSLDALTRAARRVGRGETPERLPEKGPSELRTVARAFNRMAGDLATLERERATVLAGISHDLRTPLARLRLGLEMLEGDEAVRDGIATDVDEIDSVIGQFLDFARGADEARVDTDVGALLADLVEGYRKRGLDVALRGRAARWTVAPTALRRAVTNLVNNALRHGGTPIEVQAGREGDMLAIEVLDRGPGIPESQIERLKQPFTRLNEARGAEGGAGLGLAIVDRIARAHGGALTFLAREGGGLVARLELR
jgi:two-component system, OmpR family, osmolarity sensor histidine kinase EnvZ